MSLKNLTNNNQVVFNVVVTTDEAAVFTAQLSKLKRVQYIVSEQLCAFTPKVSVIIMCPNHVKWLIQDIVHAHAACNSGWEDEINEVGIDEAAAKWVKEYKFGSLLKL